MGGTRELWPDEYTVFNILYDKFLFWSIIVGLFAFIWLLIAILRYRDGIEPAGKEELIVGTFPVERHNFTLELAWFVVPTILVVWVTWLAVGSMNLVWYNFPDPDAEDTFEVEVNGIQWAWQFTYRDALTWEDVNSAHDVTWDDSGLAITFGNGAVSAVVVDESGTTNLDLINNTLSTPFDEDIYQTVDLLDSEGNVIHRWQHIPVGHVMNTDFIIPCDHNVTLNIFSDKYGDKNSVYQGVQHAFWLQEWGMKEDAVPGLQSTEPGPDGEYGTFDDEIVGGTWMFVQPNEAGTFPVRCAEYCGEQHSVMTGSVEVVATEEMGTCEADFGIYFDNGGVR